MNYEQAFLQAIVENPDDDTPRLVFADWLEEQGKSVNVARAEFIRLQIELARLPTEDSRRSTLQARGQALLDAHATVWTSELGGLVDGGEYRRGFLEKVTMRADTFLTNADTLFRLAPVREIHFHHALTAIGRLAQSVHLARLSGLDLSHNLLSDAAVGILAYSPHLQRVRTLDLNNNEIGTSGVRSLVQSPYLHSLTTLNLSLNRLNADTAERLATSRLPQLIELNLRTNQVGDSGIRWLASAPQLAQITAFRLGFNSITPAGVSRLANSFYLRNLTALELNWNNIGDAGAVALARAKGMTALSFL